jgi:hypothetical protein
MTYLDRLTLTYTNTQGYNLAIKNIPVGWGDLTVKQYRIDNAHNMTLMATWQVAKKVRAGGPVTVAGSWQPGPPTIVGDVVYDGVGVAPGIDMIVVTGSTGSVK